MPRTLAIDANLLTVLIVGQVAPSYLGKHRRVRAYTNEDYIVLARYVGNARIIATPNVFTEASNLTRKGFKGLIQHEIDAQLQARMRETEEIYFPSSRIADISEFSWLGLTDTAWLEIDDGIELLTADAGLYYAATKRGKQVTNFNHLRVSGGAA